MSTLNWVGTNWDITLGSCELGPVAAAIVVPMPVLKVHLVTLVFPGQHVV